MLRARQRALRSATALRAAGAQRHSPVKVGILGTMVWDTIHSRDAGRGVVEEWGGVAYALSAFAAAAPAVWELVPIVRVGSDLSERALAFLNDIVRFDLSRVRIVPEPNNRVEL